MNLKDAEKVWRDSCPDEVDGVVGKRKMPKRWLLKLKLNRHCKIVAKTLKLKLNKKNKEKV